MKITTKKNYINHSLAQITLRGKEGENKGPRKIRARFNLSIETRTPIMEKLRLSKIMDGKHYLEV